MYKIIVALLTLPLLGGTVHAQQPDPPLQKSAVAAAVESAKGIPSNPAIRFDAFVQLTQKLQSIRESRRVPIATFGEMSRDPGTIILDTRSKRAFDLVHIAGAVHLNFSDFAEQKLSKVIPSKKTRILIYCNNNFTEPADNDSPIANTDAANRKKASKGVVEGITPKLPALALNIPTFINLHGYGYENVYELADQIEIDDPRLRLEGDAVKN